MKIGKRSMAMANGTGESKNRELQKRLSPLARAPVSSWSGERGKIFPRSPNFKGLTSS